MDTTHHSRAFQKTVRDTLVGLADDWYSLMALCGDARFWLAQCNDPEPAKSLALRVVEHLVTHGLMVVGELGAPGGRFAAWTVDLPTALDRIRAEWGPDGMSLRWPPDLVWFDGTETGVAEGKRLRPEFNADPELGE